MASEQLLFFGAMVVLLCFLGCLVWWKYLDKWREPIAPPSPPSPPEIRPYQMYGPVYEPPKGNKVKCVNCGSRYTRADHYCPNCGAKRV